MKRIQYFILPLTIAVFGICALAQKTQAQTTKTASTTTKPTAAPQPKPTTTPAKAAPPASTTPVIDDNVHTSATKVLTLHDPEYKSTKKYADAKKKFDKTFDDTASKAITFPDGSKIRLKMVKNPSFGGMPTSIKSTTAKGSEKKEKKTEKGTQWDCSSSSIALTASSTSFLEADYATQAGYIYPGAIYTFDNFFNGSYNEQTGARYPIMLVNENPNVSGSSYINVKNPGMGITTNAVNKLIREMKGPVADEGIQVPDL